MGGTSGAVAISVSLAGESRIVKRVWYDISYQISRRPPIELLLAAQTKGSNALRGRNQHLSLDNRR